MSTLIMGTRGSPLALAQSRQVARALEAAHSGLAVEERIIRTTGDKLQGAPLPSIGGKGVFTLEIERALEDGAIDFAVHSLKDLPPDLPPDLCIGAIPRRAAAHDVCILSSHFPPEPLSGAALPFLPLNARIGTSSLRRRAQFLHLRPDLQVEDIRGNIDTRLRKLEEQDFTAIVLAQAGLSRLQVEPGRAYALDERECVPAPGQGALALEARRDDARVLDLLRVIEDGATRAEIGAERAAMRALGAGCSTPLGARAVVEGETLHLWAVVLSPDGVRRVFVEATGSSSQAEALGQDVARRLSEQGAGQLLSVASG